MKPGLDHQSDIVIKGMSGNKTEEKQGFYNPPHYLYYNVVRPPEKK